MRLLMLHCTIAVLAASCCHSSLPGPAEFRLEPLDQQVREYEVAVRDGCLHEGAMTYLSIIADSGLRAADAMNDALRAPRASFPPRDALTVLEFVVVRGHNLRQHAVIGTLEHLISETSRADVRVHARQVLDQIQSDAPSEHRRKDSQAPN